MITFIGMGLLGSNFTKALIRKGNEVAVWNRSFDKAEALQQFGAKAVKDITEAVKGSKYIHVTLSDDAAVDDVLQKASAGFDKGAIIIDHTTTSAPGTEKRSAYWAEKGVFYIHAPVFMGPPNALESTGIMLVCGNQQIVESITAHLSAMTGKLWNLGEQPGKAAAIKLLGNLFHICLTGAVTDLLALAASLKVDAGELSPLLELMNPSAVAQGRLKKIASNTFDQPSWELAMARKDARLMIEQAESTGTKLSLIPAVAEKMDKWIDKGYGESDWTIISRDAQ